jgi:cutinase
VDRPRLHAAEVNLQPTIGSMAQMSNHRLDHLRLGHWAPCGSRGRGLRCVGRGAAALLAAGVLLIAPGLVAPGAMPLLGPGTVPPAAASDCPDVELIFARGTSEPPGVGRVGQALADSLRNQTGRHVDTYGVNYPAGKLQLGGGDGANDTISRVKNVVQQCPATSIVLGGYSQGASVVDIVAGAPVGGISWGSPLPAEYAGNITAVATFGNIVGRSGSPLSSQSQLLGSKTIDLCNPEDPICHAGPGNEWSGHTDGYVPVYTTQAATFIASRLPPKGSHGPGGPPGPSSAGDSPAEVVH